MLEKLRELSIAGWEPVGGIISAIFDSSSIWVPIVAYFVITFLSLFLLKLILDKTVSSASSWSMSFIWEFVKKLILYTLIIGIATVFVVSLYFYLESKYSEHKDKPVQKEQNIDYLLLD